MKKICYIVTIPLTIRAFFLPQLKYLSTHGYKVTVVCDDDCKLQEELGEEICYYPVHIVRGIDVKNIYKTIIKLSKLFNQERFDIIQYSTPIAGFCSAIAGKYARIKVRNYHLMGLRYIGESGFKRILIKTLERIACSFSTDIECVTKSNLELCIKEKLFDPRKATIVWNGSTCGVDLKRFDITRRIEYRASVRKIFGIAEDEFVFGFIGRITKDKGVGELLQAFQMLDYKSKLIVIGPTDEIDTIDKDILSEAQKNNRVLWVTEFVEDIERYYPAIDMLILPSYREGFGMVIAEAAAMGTPSIVSKIPGPIDVVVDKKTAFLVKPKDVDDLLEKMEYTVKNRSDIYVMSQECHNYIAAKFDSEILLQKILERKNELME